MTTSESKNDKIKVFSSEDEDRIVRMAWEDRTTFEAIKEQFNLTANEVVKFMRTKLDEKSFKRWRRRATQQGHLKHQITRPFVTGRFKSKSQRLDGSIKRSK